MLTKKSEKNLAKLKNKYKNNPKAQELVKNLEDLNDLYKKITEDNFVNFLKNLKTTPIKKG